MKYRQINSPYCDASQWNRQGDHEKVTPLAHLEPASICSMCGHLMSNHGWIQNEDAANGFIVCPGNYVLFTDFYYPLSKEQFESNYALISTDNTKADLARSHDEIAQALNNLRARSAPRPGTNKRLPVQMNAKQERGAAIYHLRIALFFLEDAIKNFAK